MLPARLRALRRLRRLRSRFANLVAEAAAGLASKQFRVEVPKKGLREWKWLAAEKAASAAQAAAEAASAAQAGAAAQQQVPQRQVTARWCVRWVDSNVDWQCEWKCRTCGWEFWSQDWPRDPSGRPGLPPECCDWPDIVTGGAGTGEA